jgi:hypothetical protein
MNGPTPRQQAGYLRRLLRRGELQLLDPRTRRPLAVAVELREDVIALVPALEPLDAAACAGTCAGEEQRRWGAVLAGLRALLEIGEAEELLAAIELERMRSALEA